MNIIEFDERKVSDLKWINSLIKKHTKIYHSPKECISSIMMALSNLTTEIDVGKYYTRQSKRDHDELYDAMINGLYALEELPRELNFAGDIVVTIGIGDVPDSCDVNIHQEITGSSNKAVLTAEEMEIVYGNAFFDTEINLGMFSRYNNNWFWGYVKIKDYLPLTKTEEKIYWYVVNYVIFFYFSKNGGWKIEKSCPVYIGFGSREWNVYIGEFKI